MAVILPEEPSTAQGTAGSCIYQTEDGWGAEAAKFFASAQPGSSCEMRNKSCGWPHLERTAAPTQTMASCSRASSSCLPLCSAGMCCPASPSAGMCCPAFPGGCSSAIVILLQSCMPSEFICHIPGTGIHQSVVTGLLISVRLAFEDMGKFPSLTLFKGAYSIQ